MIVHSALEQCQSEEKYIKKLVETVHDDDDKMVSYHNIIPTNCY